MNPETAQLVRELAPVAVIATAPLFCTLVVLAVDVWMWWRRRR